jgi:hypothetical protein
MIFKETYSYTIIGPSLKNGSKKIETILNFHKKFDEKYLNFKNINLILNFSDYINIELKEILLFSLKSEEHKKNKNSFVIVCKGIDFEELPNELIAVPTVKEAEDIIEIEDIERDLGI